MELNAEIKKELTDGFTWLDQVINVLKSLSWLFGAWLSLTTLLLGAISILIFITWTPSDDITFLALQNGFKDLLIFIGSLTTFILVFLGLPKRLRNVFHDNAQNRIDRYNGIERNVKSQVDTTELLLIKHGLITEGDVVKRKLDLPKGRLI
jgi:hypothetical protein